MRPLLGHCFVFILLALTPLAGCGARHPSPVVTSITALDPAPYVAVCLEWMKNGGRDWKGPLLVQPHGVPLFIGESTAGWRGPAATQPNPSHPTGGKSCGAP